MQINAPSFYGLPKKFTSWRETQKQAIFAAISCKKRFIFQSLPTGSGKSLAYMGLSRIGGYGRTIVLTHSKALQDQLVNDFGAMGLIDIRGMANYTCNSIPSIRANEGPCLSGLKCDLRDGGCDYYNQVARAKYSKLIVTNYSFWITANKAASGETPFGEFDLLVMDEAHLAPQILMDSYNCEVTSEVLKEILNTDIPNLHNRQECNKWLYDIGLAILHKIASLKHRITNSKPKITDYALLAKSTRVQQSLNDAAQRLQSDYYDFCLVRDVNKNITGFKVGLIKTYPNIGESLLFLGCKKILGVSGTIRPMTADMLGIRKEDYEFQEYPSTFPPQSNQIYHIKSVKINKDTSQQVLRDFLVNKMDNFIEKRTDRKGIIHVTSYAYQTLIKESSRFAPHMFFPNKYTINDTLKAFKAKKGFGVIVSPSLAQGYDFPYEDCEFQIIFKLPFPSFADELFKKRSGYDPRLSPYLTMQTLIQCCGRGMRFEDDQCENVIFDDQIEDFLKRHSGLFPFWFLQSFKQVQFSPEPLPKLKR